VFFGDVWPTARTISYEIKATSAGRFMVPPAFAESMYERGINGSSATDWIEVSAR
jgi:uncharacterized protein YfaS (alpha-2-macroglobulin family)